MAWMACASETPRLELLVTFAKVNHLRIVLHDVDQSFHHREHLTLISPGDMFSSLVRALWKVLKFIFVPK
jgi:hypothetical protein